jgi:hypothetical protein
MSIKEIIVGTVVTLVIGGTAYTVNQSDVINNFASDTGLSQQQAEEYVKGVSEDDLVPYDELGTSYITEGEEILTGVSQIDCVNYEYEWESPTLTCDQGKAQLSKLANDEISLGRSYIKLAAEDASRTDISTTVGLIGDVNTDLDLEVVTKVLDSATVDEAKKTNSYNKATLSAALTSQQ